MSRTSLEQRVTILERQMQEVLAVSTEPSSRWRETVGIFSNDSLMKEIDAAGEAWRETDRKQARGQRSARAKS